MGARILRPVCHTKCSAMDYTRPTEAEFGPTICQCSEPFGRNLVVCIDGTSNKFGKTVRISSIDVYSAR